MIHGWPMALLLVVDFDSLSILFFLFFYLFFVNKNLYDLSFYFNMLWFSEGEIVDAQLQEFQNAIF